jgi:ParB-like chromosome segregation protein Spo0J
VRILKTENKKIGVDELNISEAYQRTIVPGRVNRIAKNLDQDAFGSLTVGQRRDGSYWVVDGMQRLTAARKLGIVMVPCDVFDSDGQEHEARVFRLKNKERTNVSSMSLFKAQLTEGDEQTLAIAAVVKQAGLKLGLQDNSTKWPYIRAVKALERSFQRVDREGLLAALEIICEAWPGEDGALQGDMIEGVCWFVKKREQFDRKRLVDRLSKKSITSVLRAADANHKLAKDRDSSSYGRSMATYDAIDLIYSKGLRRAKAPQ